MATKFTDAIRVHFNSAEQPRYVCAIMSNVSEQEIIELVDEGVCVTDMDVRILVYTSNLNYLEDTQGVAWKYGIRINEHGEFLDE